MGGRCVVIAAALAMGLVAANVKAEDGVYVDLSVLNSLPTTVFSGPQFSSQPLFPEVKKVDRPQVSSVKPKKSRKIVKKKTKAVVNKVEVVEKVNVTAKPEIIVPDMAEKNEPNQPVQIIDTSANREVIAEVSSPEKTSEAPAQTPTDDMPFQTEQVQAVEENPLPAVVAEVKNDELPPITTEPEKVLETPSEESVLENTLIAVPEEVETPAEDKETAAETVSSSVEEVPVLPLISEHVEPQLPASENNISFEEGVDELNDSQKQRIDEIVRKFENPEKNKIVILSYNYEDGKDSFKKKRISLNRAIEVRSYLLGEGYKNFSIKVINISGDVEKRNLVEIEELK